MSLTVYLAGPVRDPGDWRGRFRLACSEAGAVMTRTPHRSRGRVLLIEPGGTMRLPAEQSGAARTDEPELWSDLYIPADLTSIRRADVIVAYVSAEHSGRGTAFECGYALALGKQVLPIVDPSLGNALDLPHMREAWRQPDEYAWRFLLGAVPHHYTLGTAAAAVAHIAKQLDGVSRYDPGRPG